jgi:hypothetical protein
MLTSSPVFFKVLKMSAISFTVFYDPFLSLHTSRGWDVSQIVQGRVATISGNRFNVVLRKSVAQTTAGELRDLVCETFTEKMLLQQQQGKSSEEGAGGGTVPPLSTPAVTSGLSLLSWGSTILSPDDRSLHSFGMRDSHSGALLLLETFPGDGGTNDEAELDRIRDGAKRDNDRYLQTRSEGGGSKTVEVAPGPNDETNDKQQPTTAGTNTLNESPAQFKTVDRALLLAAAERRMRAAKK